MGLHAGVSEAVLHLPGVPPEREKQEKGRNDEDGESHTKSNAVEKGQIHDICLIDHVVCGVISQGMENTKITLFL